MCLPALTAATQTVTLSCSNPSCVVYYTTDGTAPNTGSSTSEPITVATSLTLTAVAVAPGYSNSQYLVLVYTINQTPTGTPLISPSAGPYSTPLAVTLTNSTPGATIYYTTDGSTPTTGSTVYSTPFTLSSPGSVTVKAAAQYTGYTISGVASAAYTLTQPIAAAPSFTPPGAIYTCDQTVALSSATSGVTIYYTTDGSSPNTGSSVYSTPLAVNATETIRAYATKSGYTDSSIASAGYSIPTFAITSAALPNASLLTPYSFTMGAAGGSCAGYTWAIVSGAPAWMTINSSSGVLSGTPTATGSFSVVISVTD